jgi:hypothetical protein
MASSLMTRIEVDVLISDVEGLVLLDSSGGQEFYN